MPLDHEVVAVGGVEDVAVGIGADCGVVAGGARAFFAGGEVGVVGVVGAGFAGGAEADGEVGGGWSLVAVAVGVVIGVDGGVWGGEVVEGDGGAVCQGGAEGEFVPVAGVVDLGGMLDGVAGGVSGGELAVFVDWGVGAGGVVGGGDSVEFAVLAGVTGAEGWDDVAAAGDAWTAAV